MSNIRKLLCFILILSALPIIHAQNKAWGGSGIYLSLGQMRNQRLESPSMAEYLASYNSRNAGVLTEKFDPLVIPNQFAWGVGFYVAGVDAEMMFSDLSYTQTATIRDGRVREITRQSNQLIGNVGFLIPSNFLKFGAYFSMSTSRGFVSSRLINPDGTFSYGIESTQNGIFDINQMDIGYGFKGMIGIKYGFLTFQAQRLGITLFEKIEPQAMRDELGIGGDFKSYTNYDFPTFLAEDAGGVSGNASAISNGLVNPALANWRFFIGMSFCLSSLRE